MLKSVETNRDECSGVGEKMSYFSKRVTPKGEDIVHSYAMIKHRSK